MKTGIKGYRLPSIKLLEKKISSEENLKENSYQVTIHSIISSKEFQNSTLDLPIGLGKTDSNEILVTDLTKMPHVLIAGSKGAGKTNLLNVIITSLLYKKSPEQLKLVLIDPKKREFNSYTKIEKYFLTSFPNCKDPIITKTPQIRDVLYSLNEKMHDRYDLLAQTHSKNIKEYNDNIIGNSNDIKSKFEFLPYIVVVIDEFASLIKEEKEIEMLLARLAQLSRAVGIHLVIATQQLSSNIITPIIRANLLNENILIFHGSEPTRVQCAYIEEEEVNKITDFVAKQ